MTQRKAKAPLSSFGPELMQALVAGGRGRVVIPFAEKAKAHSFQRRIHTLRARMRDEDHKDYDVAARAKVSLYWGHRAVEAKLAPGGREADFKDDDRGRLGAWIVIAPQDSEFAEALAAAKITTSDVHAPKVEEEVEVPVPLNRVAEAEDLDDFVDELQDLQPKGPTS